MRAHREENQKNITAALDKPVTVLNETLDSMYKPIEDGGLGPRMDYITIEGETLHSLLFAEYAKEAMAEGKSNIAEGDGFRIYVEEHPGRMERMILGAMANGRNVECFLPDPVTGFCPEKPVKLQPDKRLSKDDLEKYYDAMPELKGKTSSEFYANRENSREHIPTVASHRAMVENVNQAGGIKEVMFGTADTEKIPNPLSLSQSRSALVTLTYGAIAHNENIPIQELFNPTMHKDLKRKYGEMVIQKASQGDAMWVAEQMTEGGEKIAKAVFAELDKNKLKTAADILKPENRWLVSASHVLFDYSQEQNHAKVAEALNQYGRDPLDPFAPPSNEKLFSEISAGILVFPRTLSDSAIASAQLQLGFADNVRTPEAPIIASYQMDYLKRRIANNPEGLESSVKPTDLGITEQVKNSVLASFMGLITKKHGDVLQNAEFNAQVAKLADSGAITKACKLSIENGMPVINPMEATKTVNTLAQNVAQKSKEGFVL